MRLMAASPFLYQCKTRMCTPLVLIPLGMIVSTPFLISSSWRPVSIREKYKYKYNTAPTLLHQSSVWLRRPVRVHPICMCCQLRSLTVLLPLVMRTTILLFLFNLYLSVHLWPCQCYLSLWSRLRQCERYLPK